MGINWIPKTEVYQTKKKLCSSAIPRDFASVWNGHGRNLKKDSAELVVVIVVTVVVTIIAVQ